MWLEPFGDKDFRLRTEGGEGFDWEVGCIGSGVLVHVPELFMTDLASIPRLLTWLIPRYGRHSQAAVLHDWLYRNAGHGYNRRESDRMFYNAMVAMKVRKSRAFVMWAAVRGFGWATWRKYHG